MSGMELAWLLGFVLMSVGLLLLPFAPAWREWRHPSDVGPLAVIRERDGDMRAFAIAFDDLLGGAPRLAMARAAADGSNEATVPVGERLSRVVGNPVTWLAQLGERPHVQEGLLVCGDLSLPTDSLCERELYASGNLFIGAMSAVRSVRADGELHLKYGCTVARWADAGGALIAEESTRLFGRAASQVEIHLAPRTRFERLKAPRILVGRSTLVRPLAANRPRLCAQITDGVALDTSGRFRRVEGDYQIPPNVRIEGHLIVGGNLVVGEGAHVIGTLKANGGLCLEADVRIDGALTSRGNMEIGLGCAVAGPLICEKTLRIHGSGVIGSESAPTTISAHRISLAEGVVVCGSIWARDKGRVNFGALA